MALVKVKKTLQIDSADRDTTKYPTNGDYVVYLPRVYKNVTSLRLKGAEIGSKTTTVVNTLLTSPLNLTGSTVKLWLDATQITGVNGGGPISTTNLKDLSGAGNNPSTVTNISLATNSINGKSTISMGSSTRSNILGPNVSNFFTVFIVGKVGNGSDTFGRIIDLGQSGQSDYNSAASVVLGLTGSATVYSTYNNANNNGGNQGNTSAFNTSGNPFISSTVYDGTYLSLTLNGGNLSSVTSPNVVYNNITLNTYSIGSNPQTTTLFVGNIGEVIIYNSALSTTDRRAVETYLGNKWGITVANPQGVNVTTNVFPLSHSIRYGENNPSINTTNDSSLPSNLYYFLLELEGLNKTDESRVGSDKSGFVDKYFAKIPMLVNNTTNIIEYNDKNLQENIATYSPAIEELNRLHIKTRTHAQQDGSGFVYWPGDYNLTFEIEYMDNQLDAKTEQN